MNYNENNVNLLVNQEYATPKKADVYLNPRLSFNRELVIEVLKTLVNKSIDPIDCLDAFSATGLCALQWKKNIRQKINVVAIDLKDESINRIQTNCELNDITPIVKTITNINEENEDAENVITLCKASANVIMHLKSFDFIHMDPFGSTAPYLDAAFKNIRNDGILVLTSTDIASLLTRNPNTVLRNYNAKVIKTEYVKELAVRTVLAGAARAAAKCNKGIKVLLSVTDKNFIFIALKIERGSKFANASLLKVSELLHCRICEERSWYPSDTLAPILDPYKTLLACECHKSNAGKTGVKIGPFWYFIYTMKMFIDRPVFDCRNGEIYDFNTVTDIVSSETFLSRSKQFQMTMKLISEEIESFSGEMVESCLQYQVPSFYYFTKNMNVGGHWPKFEKIIPFMRSKGLLASRTHFDVTAIRTNANLEKLKELICEMLQAENKI